MFPGRPYLGVGSGEALNEVPLGAGVARGRRADRADGGGDRDDPRALGRQAPERKGKHFATDRAYIHTLPRRRPPIYVSAFGPKAAAVAGELGDGLWTLADPEAVPEILDAYRGAAEDAGREPGEIVLQAAFSWAERRRGRARGRPGLEGRAAEGVLPRRLARPAAMYEHGEGQISDEELREAMIIATDPASTSSGSAKSRSSERRRWR